MSLFSSMPCQHYFKSNPEITALQCKISLRLTQSFDHFFILLPTKICKYFAALKVPASTTGTGVMIFKYFRRNIQRKNVFD
jgi:hypothetical protein